MINNFSFLNVYINYVEIVMPQTVYGRGLIFSAVSICGMKKNGGFYGL